MPDISLKIDDRELIALAKKYELKSSQLETVSRRIIETVAFAIERQAKIESPVDTGRMRSSINTTLGERSATVGPQVYYALFVHEGHKTRGGGSFVQGNPFLQRAVDKTQSQIRRIIEGEITHFLAQ